MHSIKQKTFFFTNAQFIDVKLLITFSFNICRLCNNILSFIPDIGYSGLLCVSSLFLHGDYKLISISKNQVLSLLIFSIVFFFYFTCSIFLFLSLYFLEAEVILFITFYYGYLANCFTAFLL